jgi:uncharacterized membrane protein YhaH (DUF805 family)
MTFWQKMFSFQGRLGLKDFWVSTLIVWGVRWTLLFGLGVAMFGPLIAAGAAADGKELSDEQALRAAMTMLVPMSLMLLVQLAIIWPEMAINVKRFHDRDQSGWLATIFLINAVPLLNYLTTVPTFIFWLIDLGILEGTRGPNRYGPSPNPELAADAVFA